MQLINSDTLHLAARHLSQHDKILAAVIVQAGECTLVPHDDYYGALVNSIIGQQLSVKAAAAIKQRFRDLFGGKLPSPTAILEKSVEDLRAVGFSNAKGRYVHDLAQHVLDGRIRFDHLAEQDNEEIIAELTDVKGIGTWTVHMFLIFCVGRLDVLPTGDLGIRNGVRALYGFTDAPSPEQITEIAEKNHWHPYESIATWYVWRSLENTPKV